MKTETNVANGDVANGDIHKPTAVQWKVGGDCDIHYHAKGVAAISRRLSGSDTTGRVRQAFSRPLRGRSPRACNSALRGDRECDLKTPCSCSLPSVVSGTSVARSRSTPQSIKGAGSPGRNSVTGFAVSVASYVETVGGDALTYG